MFQRFYILMTYLRANFFRHWVFYDMMVCEPCGFFEYRDDDDIKPGILIIETLMSSVTNL